MDDRERKEEKCRTLEYKKKKKYIYNLTRRSSKKKNNSININIPLSRDSSYI